MLEEEFISKEIREEAESNLLRSFVQLWHPLTWKEQILTPKTYKILAQGTDALRESLAALREQQHQPDSCPPALLQWKLCFSVCLLHLNYPRSVYHSVGCTHTPPPCLNSPGILWSLENVGDICCKHRPAFLTTFFKFLYTGRSGEQNIHLSCCCRGSAPLHHQFKCLCLI